MSSFIPYEFSKSSLRKVTFKGCKNYFLANNNNIIYNSPPYENHTINGNDVILYYKDSFNLEPESLINVPLTGLIDTNLFKGEMFRHPFYVPNNFIFLDFLILPQVTKIGQNFFKNLRISDELYLPNLHEFENIYHGLGLAPDTTIKVTLSKKLLTNYNGGKHPLATYIESRVLNQSQIVYV